MLKMLVFGDFGVFGNDGTIDPVTKKLGDAIKNHIILGRNDYDMLITTGDNFYENGLVDASDPKIVKLLNETFEIEHFNIPWFPVLGNHDCFGNITAALQIGTQFPLWKQNSRYYSRYSHLSRLLDVTVCV